jgi:hypothetical protein
MLTKKQLDNMSAYYAQACETLEHRVRLQRSMGLQASTELAQGLTACRVIVRALTYCTQEDVLAVALGMERRYQVADMYGYLKEMLTVASTWGYPPPQYLSTPQGYDSMLVYLENVRAKIPASVVLREACERAARIVYAAQDTAPGEDLLRDIAELRELLIAARAVHGVYVPRLLPRAPANS